jgi:hypothetical protein
MRVPHGTATDIVIHALFDRVEVEADAPLRPLADAAVVLALLGRAMATYCVPASETLAVYPPVFRSWDWKENVSCSVLLTPVKPHARARLGICVGDGSLHRDEHVQFVSDLLSPASCAHRCLGARLTNTPFGPGSLWSVQRLPLLPRWRLMIAR